MYPILILREELVCLIILIFLAVISRTYRMGKDGKMFHRLLTWAMLHVVMDAMTVWTVNRTDIVPEIVNFIAHAVFYLSALLFAREILGYLVHLLYPDREEKFKWVSLIPMAAYTLLLPCLKIEYTACRGTWSSTGMGAWVGYALGYVCFFLAILLSFRNWRRLSSRIRYALIPMLLMLVAAETAQILVRELLLTGGALTIVTVGFFFSLENPAIALERTMMMDAMTGVESRNSYERDIQEYDRQYQANPEQKFIFLFADMNNLKSVNGLFGHDAGDEYIQFIASTLRNCLKNAEHIYRMGGDEFLAIYRNAEEKTVEAETEQVHRVCDEAAKKKEYTPMLATGYAVSGPQYRNLHDVLRVADYMMYQHKAELKREMSTGATHKGTKLNLTGLLDKSFEAMCLNDGDCYPFMQNLETGVTRVAPRLEEAFGLEKVFFADFDEAWLKRMHPEDRAAFAADMESVRKEESGRQFRPYRVMNAKGAYMTMVTHGGVYHGKDGEPDLFAGYIVTRGPADA